MDLRVRAGREREARCPYCREEIGGEVPACEGCGARVHAECRAELRRCPTLGCGSILPPVAGIPAPEDRLVLLPADAVLPAGPPAETLLERPRPSWLDLRSALHLAGWAFAIIAMVLGAIAAPFLFDWHLRRDPWAALPAIAAIGALVSPIVLVAMLGLVRASWARATARHVLRRARPEVMVVQPGRGVALWRTPAGEGGPALWFPWDAVSGDREVLARGERSVRVWRVNDPRHRNVVIIDDGEGGVAVARLD